MGVTSERWQKFSKHEQLLNLGAELYRAGMWQHKDKKFFIEAIERALELVDLTLGDQKWENNRFLLWSLREELSKYYVGENLGEITWLYKAL